MTKKDQKEIRNLFCDERECGHNVCDFDDREHDLREIADVIGVEMEYDEEEDEFHFANTKDEARVNEALDYYYELHCC